MMLCIGCVFSVASRGSLPECRAHVVAPLRAGAVLVGSSSIRSSFGRVIAAELESKGYRVTRKGVVGAGLARPDFRDMREVIRRLPIDESTAAVFVYLGVNDGQAIWLRPSERRRPAERWLSWHDPRWPEAYGRRAQNLFDAICRRGAQRAIALLPVEVVSARLERRLKRIRALQREAARRTSCAMALSTAGENRLFYVGGRRTRRADGFHMTETGARLAWERAKRSALFSPAHRDGWAQ